jgi:hypothetical protein
MSDERDKLGSSGVFQAIVEGARKFKRAVTGGDDEPDLVVHEVGEAIGRAFVAGKFADVHALGTPMLQQRTSREQFVVSWSDAVKDRVPLTGFSVAEAGEIELAFIPGLEDVPQEQFVAFLQIAFSSPEIPLDDERAFTIGAVLLEHEGKPRLGALHAQ